MLERTASKFYPIVLEVAKKMVRHKEDFSISTTSVDQIKKTQNKSKKEEVSEIRSIDQLEDASINKKINPYESQWIMDKTKELRLLEKDKKIANNINMKVLLGYLNQSEWMYLLNIGNIMQITPLTIHDMHSVASIDVELSRDSIIEKISYLAVSYFCVSTELRFLVNLKDNPSVDPVQVRAESEFWHGKALDISCTFLPSESPLVSHIYSSYKKHHAPVNQIILEEQEMEGKKKKGYENLGLKVVRPLLGIDQCKHSPMIRGNHNMNIALSPLNMSPNNYLFNQNKKIEYLKNING
jgi:hypothetical protein